MNEEMVAISKSDYEELIRRSKKLIDLEIEQENTPMKQFRCNGEMLEVSDDGGLSWMYVVDCCESLAYTFEKIASALDADYEWGEEE
jgi:hypothetical protein